ncbi:MAG: ATP-binding cassette domain-containing protein [Chloroflexi bacterium]|nr:ATP-binding cassette domain-containing protein [Chloroflexota bacterium]
MVTIEALSFGYRADEPIIDGLDAAFAPGEVWAVTGPSGRGKSTLLYLVGLLLTPWAGRIGLGGVGAANALSDHERSRLRGAHIGFVFQDAVLDPARSVLDNVTEPALYAGMARPEARRRAGDLLERFGVRLRADHRPGEVSGGQAQRVALCRALLTAPSLLLADEPTGNLDADSAGIVIDALTAAAHADGATVLIASHDERIVAACDRVLAL